MTGKCAAEMSQVQPPGVKIDDYKLQLYGIQYLLDNPPPPSTHSSFKGLVLKVSEMEQVGKNGDLNKLV